MEKIIQYNSQLYIVEQQLFEPDELFFERINFIFNSKNLNNDSFEDLIKKSLLKTYSENYGCEYYYSQ